MSRLWVETQSNEEARALDRSMWDLIGEKQSDGSVVAQPSGPATENGQFWYDELNRIKDDPDRRYAIARRHLPLPAAWREMAVSLRTKIRQARKDKLSYDQYLKELHRLAAMSTYAGYGIIQRVPFARLSSLDLAYDRIGSEYLPLLGATDRKWMKELWGEPRAHSTAAELYQDMLQADIARIRADEEEEKQERTRKLFGNLHLSPEPDVKPNPQPRLGFFRRLFGA